MSRANIIPADWLEVANRRRPKLPHTTEWFDGTTSPTMPGWYERHFTDSPSIGHATMQWWDGEFWRANPEWARHWRQVGDYPAWRGLAEDPNRTTHEAEALGDKALKRCAAGRDGECGHAQCPQLRDGEPAKSGRHCPLDNEGSDEQ